MKKEVLHEKRTFDNVRALVEWAGDFYSDKFAYSYKEDPRRGGETKISFMKLRDDVRALASEFICRGYAGKHFALIGKLSYEWVLTYYAALSIGSVLVPLDPDWLPEDLADTVAKADVEVLFCEEGLAEKAKFIAEKAELAYEPVYLLANNEENSLRKLIECGAVKFADDPQPYYNAEIDVEKLALLVFTSGTTGKGKGVMLSQNAILSDMSDVIPYIDFGSKTVGVLPPHHTYGSSVMIIGHTMIGAEVYISAGLRYIQKELKEQKPEHLVLVPLYLETFYRRILAGIKDSGKEKLLNNLMKVSRGLCKVGIDLRENFFGSVRAAFGGNVKTVISGGAPLNPDIINFFETVGITILNGYGITECAPIVAVNRSKKIVKGSVGSVLDIDTVMIEDPNPDGEGEILVKGPNVMLGYYKDEETTKEALTEDGYFRTGDYGKLDKNNVLYITGRKKNLIILSNGKNVYPEEIENELIAVPGVLEIVVYEGQSKRGMEHNAIVAEVFPDYDFMEKNGIEDVKAYLKRFVDEYNTTAVVYKRITYLKVRNTEFPKNTLRKIMRFKINTSIE